mmetsp:Transcript_16721/g.46723  ORF Transcript_16721/g.46723 Transcript_16721/m.46723 type:complete len:240 (-) Transcript_16721:145-864(-)
MTAVPPVSPRLIEFGTTTMPGFLPSMMFTTTEAALPSYPLPTLLVVNAMVVRKLPRILPSSGAMTCTFFGPISPARNVIEVPDRVIRERSAGDMLTTTFWSDGAFRLTGIMMEPPSWTVTLDTATEPVASVTVTPALPRLTSEISIWTVPAAITCTSVPPGGVLRTSCWISTVWRPSTTPSLNATKPTWRASASAAELSGMTISPLDTASKAPVAELMSPMEPWSWAAASIETMSSTGK